MMVVTLNEQEETTVLELTGRFDNYTAPEVRQAIQSVVNGTPPQLVVNLEAVPFIDSTGLATLVQGMKQCRQLGGDLRLCCLQPPVRMVFELTRLDKAFEIFYTLKDALEAAAHAQTSK